jgi:hypothetical protein
VYPDERLTKVLKDGQYKEGIRVEVRQHHAIGGQHSMEKKQHWQNHPRHQEAEEDPGISRLATNGFAGMGQDGWTSLVRCIRHIPSKLFEPLSFTMGLKAKKGISGSGALCNPLLGPRLLGSHGEARGEMQGIIGGVWQRRKH